MNPLYHAAAFPASLRGPAVHGASGCRFLHAARVQQSSGASLPRALPQCMYSFLINCTSQFHNPSGTRGSGGSSTAAAEPIAAAPLARAGGTLGAVAGVALSAALLHLSGAHRRRVRHISGLYSWLIGAARQLMRCLPR